MYLFLSFFIFLFNRAYSTTHTVVISAKKKA